MESLTRKVQYSEMTIYMTVGFENGIVQHLSIKMAKEGSTLGAFAASIAELANIALGCGVAWSTISKSWHGKRFEPIAHPYTSILDAVAVNVDELVIKYKIDNAMKEMSNA